jgi:hypothetical protein
MGDSFPFLLSGFLLAPFELYSILVSTIMQFSSLIS